jgi:hypothetical protein
VEGDLEFLSCVHAEIKGVERKRSSISAPTLTKVARRPVERLERHAGRRRPRPWITPSTDNIIVAISSMVVAPSLRIDGG